MIEGKVATVLDRGEIVVNRGSIHGVQRLDRIVVCHPQGLLTVRDPDTQEVLGKVASYRAIFRVEQVYEKVCTATVEEMPISMTIEVGYLARFQ